MESKSKRVGIDELVEKFVDFLDNEGEMFFSTGSTEGDYDLIMSTLNSQGYWASSKYKYYFDNKLNLTKVEERNFGG